MTLDDIWQRHLDRMLIRQWPACIYCGAGFMLVDWLPWRTRRLCSKECQKLRVLKLRRIRHEILRDLIFTDANSCH